MLAFFPQSPSYSVPGNLQIILNMYRIAQPPSHITVHQLFDKIIAKVR